MKTFLIVVCLAGIIIFLVSPVVFAQPATTEPATTEPIADSKDVKLANPLGKDATNFSVVGNRLIKGMIGTTGVLAIIAFIWGGIFWMTSGGDPGRVKKGKDMMMWAIFGLVAIFGSYAILSLIFTALGAS